MSLTTLVIVIFLSCVLIGAIVWAWPQVSLPAPIKTGILLALIVVCVILLIYILTGGMVGRINIGSLVLAPPWLLG